MPSLSRFLVLAGLIVGLIYGAMHVIVSAVTPQPREMTYAIPPQKLNK